MHPHAAPEYHTTLALERQNGYLPFAADPHGSRPPLSLKRRARGYSKDDVIRQFETRFNTKLDEDVKLLLAHEVIHPGVRMGWEVDEEVDEGSGVGGGSGGDVRMGNGGG
jgi:hypothetical protein